jgi:uncharacterized membrane-anchored protein YhcB (DUF1043 family)
MNTPASKQTRDSLLCNIQNVIQETESMFPDMMELRVQLTDLENSIANKKESFLALYSNTVDLFVGSHFIMHELISSLRCLLTTTTVYEKRYHIQNINLCLCEAYGYLVEDNKHSMGVWHLLRSGILDLDSIELNLCIDKIDKELSVLKSEFCDIEMRNITAHYDNPIRMYSMNSRIIEEDEYCNAVSQYMLIHSHFTQISMQMFDIVRRFVRSKTSIDTKKTVSPPIFDIKGFAEDYMADKLASNELLSNLSEESLIKISESIDYLYRHHLSYEELKKYIATQKVSFPVSAEILYQLILIRIMVGLMRCDLTCAIRAYINSKSRVERSLQLRKVYMIEVSALTHLYGYNPKRRFNSLWEKLNKINICPAENEKAVLQEKLDELTSKLNNARRDLYTHFREGERLNIVQRYDVYKGMNQSEELHKILILFELCKKIEDYTLAIVKRIEQKEEQQAQERKRNNHNMFEKMRTMTTQSSSTDEVKVRMLTMLDEMEGKLAEFFH